MKKQKQSNGDALAKKKRKRKIPHMAKRLRLLLRLLSFAVSVSNFVLKILKFFKG